MFTRAPRDSTLYHVSARSIAALCRPYADWCSIRCVLRGPINRSLLLQSFAFRSRRIKAVIFRETGSKINAPRRKIELKSLNRRAFVGSSIAVLGAAGIRLPLWAASTVANPEHPSPGQLLLGVDYYPDQTPESLWEEDARMMAETGITNVRI